MDTENICNSIVNDTINDIIYYLVNENNIIKIQSLMRSYLSRKKTVIDIIKIMIGNINKFN